jgi:hypothetical protein
VSFVLTGLDIAAKADLARRAFFSRLGNTDDYEELEFRLDPHLDGVESGQPSTCGRLDVLVKSTDPDAVGRRFSAQAAALFLSSYPGFHLAAPPTSEEAFAEYWPTVVARAAISEFIVVDGERYQLTSKVHPSLAAPERPRADPVRRPIPFAVNDELVSIPIGRLVGTRSGDKGGNANLGVWARTAAISAWMTEYLTAERLVVLLPELAGFKVERFDFPNLRAVNFVVHGLLGRGVASSMRADPQAKALGESLRAALVDVPADLAHGKRLQTSTAMPGAEEQPCRS